MRRFTRLLAAVLLIIAAGTAWGGTITDELNPSKIGYYENSGGYVAWSGLSSFSDAVYAGKTCGTISVMMKEDGKNTGIITTDPIDAEKVRKAKKVEVEWHSNTSNGRILYIYGKNTPYEDVSDLFNDSKQGDLLGTITMGSSTERTLPASYKYIGICTKGGTAYLSEIRITWEATYYPSEISDNAISFPQNKYFVSPSDGFVAPVATLAGKSELTPPVEYSISGNPVASINSSTGAVALSGTEGTATIRADWQGTSPELGGSYATYQLVVTNKAATTTWDATTQGYTDKQVLGKEATSPITITFAAGSVSQSPQYWIISASDKKILFYNGNTLTFAAPEGSAITSININYTRDSGYNDYVTPSVGSYHTLLTTGIWEGISQYVTLTNTSEATLNPISFTITYIALEEEDTVTITDARVGTYCPTKNVVVGDGTLSTIVKGVDGSNILIEEPIYAIPAGTGVLLTGTPGTYKVYAYDGLSVKALKSGENRLVGVTEDNFYAPTNTYVLQSQSGVVAFYKVVTDNIKVPAKRAYLYFPSGAPSAFYIRERGAVVTGMEPTPAMQNEDVKEWFTISGTKATPNQKGFLIGKRPDGTTIKVLK